MEQRVVARAEVVERAAGELDVPRMQRDGARGASDERPVDRRVQREHDRQRGEQDDEQRGQEPKRATAIELGETDVAGRLALAHEQPGDEEAGQHEEHVDADEAAGESGYARVEEHHEEDRHASQAFDVGTE